MEQKKVLVIVAACITTCLAAAGTYKYLEDKREPDLAQAYMDRGMNVHDTSQYR
ncbi:MAG: hypothetical protein HRT94_03675 [Alphaproteobacteria bacterium]|nr:hypothetical protein [Alphaproteobacteria bacterium]